MRISSQLLVSAPKERVSAYLRDLKHLPDYDKKVSEALVIRQDADTAELSASGMFLGRAWKDSPKVRFAKDGGYECSFVLGRLTKMTAVYHVRPVTGGTLLAHEEVYDVSVLLRPVLLAARGWLLQAIEAEMRVIKEGAQAVDRQAKLKEIDSLA
ncbi:MAG: SRPBCC family protein [Elusimicrobia bacterium]|nr:SRPBCC family protein [Elusimicrobiota bacterium]